MFAHENYVILDHLVSRPVEGTVWEKESLIVARLAKFCVDGVQPQVVTILAVKL
jgi:hypothetical protein